MGYNTVAQISKDGSNSSKLDNAIIRIPGADSGGDRKILKIFCSPAAIGLYFTVIASGSYGINILFKGFYLERLGSI